MPLPVPTPALACAIASAAVAATAVAGQRVGLALALALLLAIAAGLLGAQRRPSLGMAALAAALAAQPSLRDAGWVVATAITAAVVAALVAAAGSQAWAGVRHALLAPWRQFGGAALAARWERLVAPGAESGPRWPVVRGAALALVLTATFGTLFATADSAFAEVLGQTFDQDIDAGAVAWRIALALAFLAAAATIATAGAANVAGAGAGRRRVPGRTELVIALGSVVVLFAMFVAVQVRVLFGGAAYVQATTGLGYGDYARQGFVQLLVVAALTLALIAFAARRRDRTVRALLGALCLLTLVVLLSAYRRLDLVEQAYGFTRVRYAGHAIVLWLAAVFGLVLLGGWRRTIGRRVPRVAVTVTLAGALVFSLSNPDGRIAQRAVDRAAAGGPLDVSYLDGLSADALPALERLSREQRELVVPALRERLRRPDGVAGLNLSRARARGAEN